MHVAKYTQSQMGNMLTHYNRNRGQDRNYSNDNIDKDKIKDNYNLGPERNIPEVDFIRDRLKEVKHMNRADTIKIADWCVTLPKNFEGSERDFFEATYNALESRYGRENVVSAYVHKDEKTPHMHFAFMPITRALDRDNRPIEKLCAKEVLNRQELKNIHKDIERVLERKLDKEVNILNRATKNGNKAIKELKRDTAIKDLQKVRDLEKIKDIDIPPVKVKKTLRGETITLEEHNRVIEKLQSELHHEKQINRELYERNLSHSEREEQLRKSRKLEHEKRLELQDKLQDKSYLKEHLKELEKEHKKTRDLEPER